MNLPNDPLKLPWVVLCAVALGASLVVGKYVVVGAIGLAGCLICIGVIASGRSPRWLQSPLDRQGDVALLTA